MKIVKEKTTETVFDINEFFKNLDIVIDAYNKVDSKFVKPNDSDIEQDWNESVKNELEVVMDENPEFEPLEVTTYISGNRVVDEVGNDFYFEEDDE